MMIGVIARMLLPALLLFGCSTDVDIRYTPDDETISFIPEPNGYSTDPDSPITSENGDRVQVIFTMSFAMNANARPTELIFPVASVDPDEILVEPAELIFTSTASLQPKVFTLVGVDDDERDGDSSVIITIGPEQSGAWPHTDFWIRAFNLDNEMP